jgi:hypothetical protein
VLQHPPPWHIDAAGNRWRCYHFVEGATGHDVVRSPEQAYAAAKSFGAFQSLLADLPGERLHETIPDFHHTPSRFARFQQALAQDAHGRAAAAVPEIAFALARAHEVSVVVDALRDGTLPERVTHNDTKLNNVLLDDITQEGVCVIDLDTVMLPTPLSTSTPNAVDPINDPYTAPVAYYAAYKAKFKEQSYGEAEIFKQQYDKQVNSVLNSVFTRRIPDAFSNPY